ncbi:helix-turn-helix domain-containing protein [Aquihabitans sp. G128]|uniref:helix-turn-helix domain-containing protein n=1 Tax=Aquihabitans sp. G128 TaxID=2849779 RepID=UPI001C24E38F|nr:helix-turn-helix domain-containing protein [Aquihabitans sp. G128]QXC60853.1 helix-turn-helix domain-containing protein [Aquihabitans sp. G128]
MSPDPRRLLDVVRAENRAAVRAREVGTVLASHRCTMGLTVRACAGRAAISPARWREVEQGRCLDLDDELLGRLAAVVGTTGTRINLDVELHLSPTRQELDGAADVVVVLDRRLRDLLGQRPQDPSLAPLLGALHEATLVLGELGEHHRILDLELAAQLLEDGPRTEQRAGLHLVPRERTASSDRPDAS